MKLMTVLSVLFACSLALGTNRQVEVISFDYWGPGHYAELCGRVKGPIQFQDRIEITTDYKRDGYSRKYTVIPNSEGEFCSVIRSYAREALVQHTLFSPSGSIVISEVTVSVKKSSTKN